MNIDRVTPQSAFNTQSASLTAFLGTEDARNHLYQHQIEATLLTAAFLRQANSNIGLDVLPTGTGKSGIAVLCAYATNSNRVLVITPSLQISVQIAKDFEGFLIARGIIPAEQAPNVVPPYFVVKNSRDFPACLTYPLIITNAHKIGGRSRIPIADIPALFDLVIVDEAHHYPAPTWKLVVDHFPNAKRLFLTATPEYKGNDIIQNQAANTCFRMSRQDAVARGVIRPLNFSEVGVVAEDDHAAFKAIANEVRRVLAAPDAADPGVFHQAMILAQTTATLNSAEGFARAYNEDMKAPDLCEVFIGGDSINVVTRFTQGQFRSIVVVGRLLEGFDHKRVSVVAIARNVAPASRVLFGQFVGRAVRKIRPDDPVTAVVVSHPNFKQRANYEAFDRLPDDDIAEPEEDE